MNKTFDIPVAALPLMAMRFRVRLLGPAVLPRDKAGVVHGSLGRALNEVSPEAFALLFGTEGEDFPRPFTLLPPLFKATELLPGSELVFELTLLGDAVNHLHGVLAAIALMGDQGWGEKRTSFEVVDVRWLLPRGTGREGSPEPVAVRLGDILDCAPLTAQATLEIEAMTPLRIKHEGGFLQEVPPLSVYLHRLIGRVNQLCCGLGCVSPTMRNDLLASAQQSYVSWADANWQDWERYSARQRASMRFGGLQGRWQWCDVPASVVPWLSLSQWLGVGGKTTFGLGQVRLVT